GLIRYSTENALRNHWSPRTIVKRVLRPRVLVYTTVLGAIVVAAAVSLWMRVPMKMDVIRDRAALAREVEDDRVENVYRLQLMNTGERPHRFTIEVNAVKALEHIEVLSEPQPLEIAPVTTRMVTVRVRAEPHGHTRGSQPITFVLQSRDEDGAPFALYEKSRFLVP
ncbi:MAG TPA: FixG Ig-like domain-containing protein, partial [Usitatibacter sp.]|nr:FixG Ig-like domain-containing protein [Usitatibacter sp.]